MRGRKLDRSVYKSFAMITQFGINMLVPIGLMTWLGVYLDKRFGTSYIMVLLFFVGALAGGRNVYHMARQIYSTGNKQEDLKVNRQGSAEKLTEDDREIKKS